MADSDSGNSEAAAPAATQEENSNLESASAGLRALLENKSVTYERLPMLEVVFDRLVRSLSVSLRNLTSDNVNVAVTSIDAVRFGDFMEQVPTPPLINVFQIIEWDNYGLLTVDQTLAFAIVDVLMGNRDSSAPRVEDRPYTNIERSLVERLAQMILSDLTHAFEPVMALNIHFDRLESNPRFVQITRPGSGCIRARLKIEMDSNVGNVELLLPYGLLEPARDQLLQLFLGEKLGRDIIWESHFSNQLLLSHVDISAELDSVYLPLREVLGWKVGEVLQLSATPDSLISLHCSGKELFRGTMGRKGDRVAIRVSGTLVRHKGSPEDA